MYICILLYDYICLSLFFSFFFVLDRVGKGVKLTTSTRHALQWRYSRASEGCSVILRDRMLKGVKERQIAFGYMQSCANNVNI